MIKLKPIKWKTIPVEVTKIKPTRNNYKLKTEDGTARFNNSIEKYGLAGAVILNLDMELIDGNTRWEKAKEKKLKFIDASIPNRKLTPKEFNEFSAMYDMARAGEVDVLRIKQELGTSDDFFEQWGFPLPKLALEKLAELERNEAVVNPTAARPISEKAKEIPTSRITLLFTKDEADEFLRIAEALHPKFKTDNVTDLALKVFQFVKKSLNKK